MTTQLGRAGLLALMTTSMLLSAPLGVPRAAGADAERDALQPLCLTVLEGRTVVFPLRVLSRHMFEPEPDEVLLVKGIVNGTEPALGAATRLAPDTVVVNLSSSVAGFFSALQITWNPRSNRGTGRVVGELSDHPHVLVVAYPCR